MKLLIGVVGENGAGKSLFGQELTRLARGRATIQIYRFSTILSETLDLWHQPRTRRTLQQLPQVLEELFGQGALAAAMRFRLEASTADIIILDGMRWQADQDLVRSLTPSCVIYITADAQTRFNRLKNRGEKVGEIDMTWEQFLAEDQVKSEQLIPVIGASADVVIVNQGPPEQFLVDIQKFYHDTLLPMLSKP